MASTACLWAACALSGLGFLGHTLAGGRLFVRPLREDAALSAEVKWLGYCSWHAVSTLLLASTVAFGWAARSGASRELAVFASGMAGAFALVVLAAALRSEGVLFRVPALYLFSSIALLGAVGVVAAPG